MQCFKPLIDLLGILIETLACIKFFSFVFKTRKINDKMYPIVIFGYIAVHFTMTCLINNANILTLAVVVAVFVLSYIYEAKMTQRILYTVILMVMILLSEMIIGLTLSVVFSKSTSDYTSYLYGYLTGTVSSKLLMYAVIKIISFYKRNSDYKLPLLWIIPFSTLPVATICAAFVLSDYMYTQTKLYIIVMVVISFLLLVAANIVVFYLFERQQKLYENELRAELINNQIHSQMEYYKSLSEQQKLSNKTLHDLKHNMYAVREMVTKGETAYAVQKLDEIYGNIMKGQPISNTGIDALDTLINMEYEHMKKNNIAFNINVHMLPENTFDIFDICALLGNLLDNAIEACSKVDSDKRYISLKIMPIKGALSIVIENSVSAKVEIVRNSVAVRTTKSDKRLHGIGLESVKNIVEKYDGEIALSCTEDVFSVDIFMKLIVSNIEG